MGLRLINADERLTFEGDGFKIFYRRIPNARRGRIMEKNTKRGGEVNFNRATIEMLEYSVTGWDGFYTQNGSGERQDVAFDPGKIEFIPDEVQAELMELIGANADRGDVEAKNSPTSSDSSTTTKATVADGAD